MQLNRPASNPIFDALKSPFISKFINNSIKPQSFSFTLPTLPHAIGCDSLNSRDRDPPQIARPSLTHSRDDFLDRVVALFVFLSPSAFVLPSPHHSFARGRLACLCDSVPAYYHSDTLDTQAPLLRQLSPQLRREVLNYIRRTIFPSPTKLSLCDLRCAVCLLTLETID